MSSQMPSPPFPDPGSPVLKLIVTAAVDAVRSGEATAGQAILHAAVHGWYEGHIEGEDACLGCNYRGDLPKQADKGGWIPALTDSPSDRPGAGPVDQRGGERD